MTLKEFLKGNAKRYDFYQLTGVLLEVMRLQPDQTYWKAQFELLFTSSSNMGFAESDIKSLSFQENHVELETTFLGLTGAQSPLPNFFLDELAIHDDEGIRKDFLGFFNHRILNILYQGWRKYRYYETFEPDATDKISHCFFSLIGLRAEEMRKKSAINWCKMLAYIGLITGRNRSGQVLSGVLSHYFDLNASVDEWVLRQVDIPSMQQTGLGYANCHLGETTLLGSRIEDRASKFVITLHDLKVERFMSFLPSGLEHETLKEVVQFMMRTQMAYDLCLEISPYEITSLNLSKEQGSLLGWTSFMGQTDVKRHVYIQMQG